MYRHVSRGLERDRKIQDSLPTRFMTVVWKVEMKALTSKVLGEVFTKYQLRNVSFRKVLNWYAGLGPARSKDPPYSHVTQIGDPVLRAKCRPVPPDMLQSGELFFLVEHLKTVLRKYKSCGLSAPQVGVPLRMFVMEFGPEAKAEFTDEVYRARRMSIVPFSVFVNPEVKVVDYNRVSYPEACESVKGFCADVPRYSEVEVRGLNERGEQVAMRVAGWPARIVQHEMDHLDGRLYTDVMDRLTLTCSCWQAVNKARGRVELPFTPS